MANDSEPDAVLVSYPHPGITVISLNRPQARNAVNAATAQKLYDAIVAYEEDEAAKVAVFNGENGIFCAGFDLKSIKSSDASTAIRGANIPSGNADERVGTYGTFTLTDQEAHHCCGLRLCCGRRS